MRSAIAVIAVLALGGCVSPPVLDPSAAVGGRYAVDPAHAVVSVSIGHLGLSRYPGRLTEVSGELQFDADAPEASAMEITIPAWTIDLPDDGLEATIRGRDWLDVRNHPTIRFVVTGAERTGDRDGVVEGALTLRGVTRPIALETRFNGAAGDPFTGAERLGFSATGAIDRRDFGMTALPGFVGDEIEIGIEIEFLGRGATE